MPLLYEGFFEPCGMKVESFFHAVDDFRKLVRAIGASNHMVLYGIGKAVSLMHAVAQRCSFPVAGQLLCE